MTHHPDYYFQFIHPIPTTLPRTAPESPSFCEQSTGVHKGCHCRQSSINKFTEVRHIDLIRVCSVRQCVSKTSLHASHPMMWSYSSLHKYLAFSRAQLMRINVYVTANWEKVRRYFGFTARVPVGATFSADIDEHSTQSEPNEPSETIAVIPQFDVDLAPTPTRSETSIDDAQIKARKSVTFR